MIKIDNKGSNWIFTNNKKIDLEKIKHEYNISPTSINESSVVSNGTASIPVTTITTNRENYIISNDKISFRFMNPKNLVSYLDIFPTNINVSFDEVKFSNKFRNVNSDSIMSSNKKIKIVPQNTINKELINQFIYYIKKDNGYIISPLTKRFSKTAFLFGDKKRMLLGYASIYRYFEMINNTESKLLDDVRIDYDSNYVIQIPSNNSDVQLHITSTTDIVVKMDGELKNTRNNVLLEPYMLFTTTPVKIQKLPIPYFVVSHGKAPIFVSVVTFMDDFMLTTIKGRIDLLTIK